jgi:hypothetical protein
MQTNNETSDNTREPIPHPRKLLIPAEARWGFLLLFTSMTVLGWVVGGIASLLVEKSIVGNLPPEAQPEWLALVKYITTSIVFATIFATAQAFAVYRYVSGWLWLFAMSAGWIVFNSVGTSWKNYFLSIALSGSLEPDIAFLFSLLSTFAFILSAIWLGLFQYLVLRRHAAAVWWWNFLPVMSFLLIHILVWLLSVVQELIPEPNRNDILYVTGQVSTALILGLLPAIAFCFLKIKIDRRG